MPLLVPVAQKMGIDLIWFGVIIAINLQTSFLTPPFGFALFYLRSVAARNDYTDRITQTNIPAVTTGQIYKGAIAFIIIQVFMLGLVIAYPNLVLGSLDPVKKPDADLEIEFQPSGYDRGYGPASDPSDWKDEEDKPEGKAGAEDKDESQEEGAQKDEKEDDPAADLMKEMAKEKKKKR